MKSVIYFLLGWAWGIILTCYALGKEDGDE